MVRERVTSESSGEVQSLVELAAESLELRLREEPRSGPCKDRDPVDEGHVVRLPDESDHVPEGGLRDDLLQAVIQEDPALLLAEERQNRLQPGGIELLRIDGLAPQRAHVDDLDALQAELEAKPVRGRGSET